jgi:hypothetical protein
MYSEYQNIVSNILKSNNLDFKSNKSYTYMLEHVSYEQGKSYIYLIIEMVNDEFKEISFENINDYLLMNDKYGNPIKHNFMYNGLEIMCSPTSLRYVLHSLLILKHFKTVSTKKMVEVGCGYGGLFLGINHFAKILNMEIDKYYFIDLPEITNLIKRYIELHNNNININFSIVSAYNYGTDINDDDLFFISNYCFTEIEEFHRNNYIKYLFPKISSGFIIWQTGFNVPIHNVNIINKHIKYITEELPQTAPIENKNYYVYF